MQRKLSIIAENDKRTNDDKAFLQRANRAQRKDWERVLKTKIAADGVEVSMFEDAKKQDANGQVNLF